jgi:hypothetical protein
LLQEAWGRFELSVERAGDTVVARRRLDLQRAVLAGADAEKARRFFERARSSAAEPIVLTRK